MRLHLGLCWGALALGLLLSPVPPAAHADEIKTERVHFKKGASAATLSGHIKGYNSVDYVLGAKAGQTMSVKMTTKSTASFFNVLPPGSDEEAIFVGSTEGNEFAGTLSKDGDYRIRVYLMRNAARRNEQADFTLKVAITDGTQAAHTGHRGKVDATGIIPCAMATGQPMGDCNFAVVREGGGSATVTVTKPDGRTRAFFFEHGKFVSADTSQAEGNQKTSSSREGDLTTVHVGAERYEIPDAVMFGG